MITQRRKVGDLGERLARSYLEGKGYRIVETNFLKPWGEIDIVAQQGGFLVFIEVKTKIKQKSSYLPPEANVGYWKSRKVARTAETYLMERLVPENIFWRIDVVSVELNYQTRKAKIKHFENAIVS